ncbi:uncharacterized protein LOC130798622 isoform X1 [Amaranthus tricolor]|uniref:uncharacterized protein LOC130798622 isoform X1 n=1 Tax=Amaranthus tricolor TaxID=29722 RepID=UPI0025863A24|nr:uncharacterized protein LOC130798622 isoform X1 [Amaranthus tricolor]
MEVSEIARKSNKGIRAERIPLSVYLAKNMENNSGYQVDLIKVDSKSYDSLVTQKDRNKENKAILSKWTTYKLCRDLAVDLEELPLLQLKSLLMKNVNKAEQYYKLKELMRTSRKDFMKEALDLS